MISDLSAYFADPCWMFVHLARNADTAVIMRRGPTKWCHLTLWDTRRDRFQQGQWFHGRVYPERCDLSPDGTLLVYFAGKFKYPERGGYGDTWTAVSRPPYFTALTLWTVGGTWGGGGVFRDNRSLAIGYGKLHPNHPLGPLRVIDPWPGAQLSHEQGWVVEMDERKRAPIIFRKHWDGLTLEREAKITFPSRRPSLYTLSRSNGDQLTLFEAQWADFDHRGRLVATAGGRVLAAKISRKGQVEWRELAGLQDLTRYPLEAPLKAQRWA